MLRVEMGRKINFRYAATTNTIAAMALELELELIHTHKARTRTRTNTNTYGTKPVLRVEVGARALRNQAGGEGGGGWIPARVAEWGARVSVVASSRGNIPSCELMGHMPMDLSRAI